MKLHNNKYHQNIYLLTDILLIPAYTKNYPHSLRYTLYELL